ncbi:class I SAM-dependent methyltransferase [Nitratifractor sp.]
MAGAPDYSPLPLHEIQCRLEEAAFSLKAGESFSFLVVDPDLCAGRYAGEGIEYAKELLPCRGYRSWIDLATFLGYRMLTPEKRPDGRVLLRFQKLDEGRSFHRKEDRAKYDPHSHFARLNKNEEPAFLYYYRRALKRLGVEQRRRILDLGIHDGAELEPLRRLAAEAFSEMEIVGVDRAAEALAQARERYPDTLRTHCHDIGDLASLDLDRFDLILSIGTLQSPDIELKPLIMELVQRHLTPGGALLLGWPNSRWIDGELLYGARPPNYPFSELSLVIKDLFWIKKYLQQHRFRVVITGREYLFLEATRIGEYRK